MIIGYTNIEVRRNVNRELFNKYSGCLLSGLSEILSRIIGDIERRKFFKILFLKKGEEKCSCSRRNICSREVFGFVCQFIYVRSNFLSVYRIIQ